MRLSTVTDHDLRGKRVLIRVDFNVPLKDDVVTDDTRIVSALPTITHILAQEGTSLVVMSHFGRPKGKKDPAFSMAPVAKRFEQLLGRPVKLASV
jgi:phosphoglycerate kinase